MVFSQLMAMGATLLYNRRVILLVKLLLVKVLLVKLHLVKVCMAHNGYEDELPLVVLHQLEACGGNLGRILLFLETCFFYYQTQVRSLSTLVTH